jgi:hypothetical protein
MKYKLRLQTFYHFHTNTLTYNEREPYEISTLGRWDVSVCVPTVSV